jgi:hypothetical protein
MAEQVETGNTGVVEKAKASVTDVQEKAGEALEAVRGKAGNLQATLADKLEAGAEALRQRSTKDGDTGTTYRAAGRVAEAGQEVAGRLNRTATWLRENDLTDLGQLLQRQLRESPGRTALLTLGVGFLLGRTLRR